MTSYRWPSQWEIGIPGKAWDISSGDDIPRPCTEVHCNEIGVLVSHDTLYRESLYTVLLPGDMEFLSRVLSYVRGLSSYGVDPWDFLRRHLSVWIYIPKLYFGIF